MEDLVPFTRYDLQTRKRSLWITRSDTLAKQFVLKLHNEIMDSKAEIGIEEEEQRIQEDSAQMVKVSSPDLGVWILKKTQK